MSGEVGPHKKRAALISYLVIVAAVFTVANNLAKAYGVLPYDYYSYYIVQWAIIGFFAALLYFIYVWNSRQPVYREAFWMVVIYTFVASWLLSAAPW